MAKTERIQDQFAPHRHRYILQSIDLRIAAFLAAFGLILFGSGVVATQSLIQPAFDKLEEREALANMRRAQAAIQSDIIGLRKFVLDWAIWDDMYRFVEEANPAFVQSNLVLSTFLDQDLDAISIHRRDGASVWSAALARTRGSPRMETGVPAVVSHLQTMLPNDGEGLYGLVGAEDGEIYMTAIEWARQSDWTGEPNGYVILARRLDLAYWAGLKERLSMDVELNPASGNGVNEITMLAEGEEMIAYMPLKDVAGKPLAILTLTMDRDLTAISQQTTDRFLIAIAAAVLATGIMLWLGVRLMVLNPIKRVASALREIDTDTSIDPRTGEYLAEHLPISRGDEVGLISRSILRLQGKVLSAANLDPLTGIPTRRLFLDRLDRAYRRMIRQNHPSAGQPQDLSRSQFAVLYVDLNDFKPINDRYGHAAGDAVLKAVAIRLTECLRQSDTAARLGGDEFAVLLDSPLDRGGCLIVNEKIAEAVARPIDADGTQVTVTASIGAALYPDDGDSVEAILAAADEAMYEVKRGRHR